jgi:hypothetical protein
MNSASLCSLTGQYENPIPPQYLAPIDFLKIPAQAEIGEIFVVEEKLFPSSLTICPDAYEPVSCTG